jgi:hypothetical protein
MATALIHLTFTLIIGENPTTVKEKMAEKQKNNRTGGGVAIWGPMAGSEISDPGLPGVNSTPVQGRSTPVRTGVSARVSFVPTSGETD